MLNIGKYNTLTVGREVDFGLYLNDGQGNEVLLPARYATPEMTVGAEVEVFVYKDSEDRPVATTERPFATVGDFAFLQVNSVNKVGAFLDWGLYGKELLVPFAEQGAKMFQGGIYLVYVYLDHETDRVAATAKVDKYLDNVYPDFQPGDRVKALIRSHTDIGYKAIVNNAHSGMFYDNELDKPLELQSEIDAVVKCVRPDGKLDLALAGESLKRIHKVARAILGALSAEGGTLPVGDASEADEIRSRFDCSKKDFKKAVGMLYKEHKITVSPDKRSISKA